jgi:hypothetical protein
MLLHKASQQIEKLSSSAAPEFAAMDAHLLKQQFLLKGLLLCTMLMLIQCLPRITKQ